MHARNAFQEVVVGWVLTDDTFIKASFEDCHFLEDGQTIIPSKTLHRRFTAPLILQCYGDQTRDCAPMCEQP